MRVISEGCVFGETNFALGISSQTSLARASVDKVTVQEISGHSVSELLGSNAEMRARLYFVLCQVSKSFCPCQESSLPNLIQNATSNTRRFWPNLLARACVCVCVGGGGG